MTSVWRNKGDQTDELMASHLSFSHEYDLIKQAQQLVVQANGRLNLS